MATPILPRAQSAMVDNASMPAREWYDFFRSLLEFVDENSDVAAEIAGILLRLEALENDDTQVVIWGLQSVRVTGNATDGFKLNLQGDTNGQGNTYYYGSGPDGAKGWFPVSDTITASQPGVQLTTGPDGVTDILHGNTSSVANLTSDNSGTVVIQDVTVTFDTFGHVLTATVGTVDVATALTGTFDPAGSAAAALLAANTYTDDEIATLESDLSSGTTEQFWRGDGVFSSTLGGGGATQALLNFDTDATTLAGIQWLTAGVNAWGLRKTGSGQFQVKRYDQTTGALIDNPLTIDDGTGDWTIIGAAVGVTGNLTVTGAATVTTDLTVNDDLTVTDDAAVGGDLTVTGDLTYGGFVLSRLVKQPANVINNNAVADTMQDVTGLSFPVLNGGLYRFKFFIVYSANATTTGSRWSINGPAGTMRYRSEYSLTTTTRTTNDGLTAFDSPAAANASSAATAGNVAIIEGVFAPSADGNVIARFASEVASAAITATANSHVEYQRIN